MKSIWEKIFDDTIGWTTWRMKVPGGWLVSDCDSVKNNKSSSPSLCFLPDPNWQWIKWEIETKDFLEHSENRD